MINFFEVEQALLSLWLLGVYAEAAAFLILAYLHTAVFFPFPNMYFICESQKPQNIIFMVMHLSHASYGKPTIVFHQMNPCFNISFYKIYL